MGYLKNLYMNILEDTIATIERSLKDYSVKQKDLLRKQIDMSKYAQADSAGIRGN